MLQQDQAAAAVGADGTSQSGLRRVYAAVIITGLGEGVFWIALVSLFAPEADFELLLTAAVVVRLAPRALFSYRVGRLLDRSDLRTVLISTEGLRGLLFLGLAGLVAVGVGAWVVLVVVLVAYSLGVPTRPAVMAVLPRLSGETNLAAAAATLSTIRQLVTFAGPLLGVAVVQASVPAGFAVKGVSFVASAVLIASIRRVRWPGRGVHGRLAAAPGADAPPPSDGPTDDRTGPDSTAPRVGGLTALAGGMYAVRGAEMVLYVLVVTELLDAPAASLGFLAGGAGLGALLAAPIATRVVERVQPATTLGGAVALTAAPTAALAVVGSMVTASLATAVVGLGMVLFEVTCVLTLQRVTPEGALGRVFGAVDAASNAGMLAGALLVPALVALVGVDGALRLVATGLATVFLVTAPSIVRTARAAADRSEVFEPIVDTLRRIALFSEAPQTALERLAATVRQETAARGEVVLRQGDPADDLFLVRGGDLEVVVDGRRVNVIGTDGWFGEIGLVDQVPRTATIRAVTRATLWRIPGDVFLNVLVEGAAPPTALLDGIRARSRATGQRPPQRRSGGR